MRTALFSVLLAAGLGACAAAPQEEPTHLPAPGDTLPAPPPATAAVLPANTHLTVELQAPLELADARVGQTFTVSVAEPLVARNGATVVPEGSVITGMVTGVQPDAAADRQPVLRLNFLRVNVEGVTHPLSADIVEVAAGAEPQTADVRVLRGEQAEAIVAGGLGAGAGTIIILGAAGPAPRLPAGTRMTIRTKDTLQLR